MKDVSRIRSACDDFFQRHARLNWVRTWGVSVLSLASGLGTLFVFRRGLEYFPLFVGYLLLVWLAGVVLVGVRKGLADRVPRVLSFAIDYTVQTLLHGLLLFLLPIYYASTTLWSGNVWLLMLLAAAAVLTTLDPWYRAVLARAQWVEIGLFWVGLFASLNVAFPLIGVGGEWVLALSGGVSILALFPAARQYQQSWGAALLSIALGTTAVITCLGWIPEWIPPVPLYLTRGTFARAIDHLEPVEPIARISRDELRTWGRVAAFTAISAPSGLNEPIYHVWRKGQRVMGRVLLTTIRGGRPGGFRTYSWKTDLGSDPAGEWAIDVRTVSGQLVGRVRLEVTAP